MARKGKPGWFRHPVEHALAAKGIKTRNIRWIGIPTSKNISAVEGAMDDLVEAGYEDLAKYLEETGDIGETRRIVYDEIDYIDRSLRAGEWLSGTVEEDIWKERVATLKKAMRKLLSV